MLASLPQEEINRHLASLTDEVKAHLFRSWTFWARPDQLAPEGDWFTWLILAGRGWGKTRPGAEWVKQRVENGAKRIALIAETQKDLEEVMIEGDSGLLALYRPEDAPVYRKKPVSLVWPNGAIALGYNGTQPAQLRGPQFDTAWCDELAKWRYARETWDMLEFGMRKADPKVCVTTTPRDMKLLREMIADMQTVLTKGRTMDNVANLDERFMKRVVEKYSGTRLGRQELEAELLEGVVGAIWKREWFDGHRITDAPKMKRIVVAIDPAVSSAQSSDDPGTHGIVAAGVGTDGRGYVLADESTEGTPREWASKAVALYNELGANQVVVEENQGGDMVESTLRSIAPALPIRRVRATRGKHVRAEPVASLYEQGRISHVGTFAEMEDQMCLFTNEGYTGESSPDRTDAAVWALTDLFKSLIYHTDEPKAAKPKPRRYFREAEADNTNYKVI